MIEDDLAIRLNYHGGPIRQDRMIRDKLWSLRSAMRSSYHRGTAILSDSREFNCLMNPSKLNADVDYKEISIPFKDVCLNEPRVGTTTQGMVDIPMKCGDIFGWKETQSEWLVYVQHIDELAYFRAGCYKCNIEVQFGKYTQKGHLIGPGKHLIDWRYSHNEMWNNINYDGVLLLPKTTETLEYLKRFGKLKTADNQQWEVQARNTFLEGILEIAIKEDYVNAAADAQRKDEPEHEPLPAEAYIAGPATVDPLSKCLFTIENMPIGGTWTFDTSVSKLLRSFNNGIELGITSKKSGKFMIIYTYGNMTLNKEVKINSM